MLNRWLGTTIRFLAWISTALVVTACGGGGGGSDSGGGFLGGGTTEPYTLSIASYDASGSASTSLSRANPLTIVVTLKQNNKVVSGEAVSLSTTVGTISPENGSALTNADGEAIFTLSYANVVGAGQLSASFSKDGESASATFSVESFDIGSPYSLEVRTLAPNGVETRSFSAQAPMTVQATLYDVSGTNPVPVEGEVIALATTIGTVSPENGSKLTDVNGRAVFTLSADGNLGAGVLNLTYTPPEDADPVVRTTNIESKDVGELYGLSIATYGPNGAATQEFTADEPLTVRVALSSSVASVAGQLISLSSTLGTVAPANGQTLTDENGRATFVLNANDIIGAGVLTAAFTNTSGVVEASTNVERVASELNRALRIQTFAPDGTARSTFNENEPLTVRVSIVDNNGAVVRVDDQVIDLSTTVGSVDPSNGSRLTTNGVAEFKVSFDQIVGAGQLTATYALPEGTLVKNAAIEARSISENYVLEMTKTGGDFYGQLTPSNPLTVKVRLLNGVGGAGVAGEIIKLNTAIASVSPGNGEALTDGNGYATFTLSYADVDGAGVVEATYVSPANVTFANSLNIQSANKPPYRLQIVGTTGVGIGFNSNQFNTVTPVTVTLKLTDDSGRALGSEQITVQSTVGILEPANGVILTNSTGTATFEVIGTGTTGAGAFIATYTGDKGEVVATGNIQEVATPTDYALSVDSISNGGVITESGPVTIRVLLSSPGGLPVAQQVVNLSTNVGDVSPANGSRLTDDNGYANFTVSFNGTVGAGVANITFDGPSGTVGTAVGLEAISGNIDTQLAIATFDPSGNTTNQFSVSDPLTVRVTLLDGAGNALTLDNEIVTLSTDIGVVTPTNGTALTVNGVAEFTLSANGTLGAGTLQASYAVGGVTVTQTAAVQAVSGDPFILSIQSSGGNLSAINPLTITVTLTDENGVVQPNEIVTANSTIGALVAGSAVTDTNGEAVFTLNFDGDIGAGVFVASFASPGGTISNTLNISSVDAPPPYLLEIAAMEDRGGNATNQFSTESPLYVTVRLLELDGVTPVTNTVVALTSTLGSILPSNGTALTDNNGEAVFTVTGTGETGAGVVVASYGSGDTALTVQRNVQAVSVNQNYTLTISNVTNGGVVTPSQAVEITVNLASNDASLYPVSNQVIDLSSQIGTVGPDNGSARTDGSGDAVFTISYDGVVGAGTVTATYSAAGGAVTALTAIESTSPAAQQFLRITTLDGAVPSSLFGPQTTLTVEVAIIDAAGIVQTLDGEVIDLSTSIGALNPPNGRALTSAGVATFELAFDGNVGAGELTAQWDAGSAVVQAIRGVQAVVENNYQLSVTQLTAGDLTINNPLTFEIELLNEDNSPADGEIVSLSSTNGILSQTSVLTDANGLATVVVSYAGAASAGTLTASFTSAEGTFTNTANFRSVDEPPAYVLNIVSTTDPNGVATTKFSNKAPLTVLVRLTEADGITPVVGELVDLETTIGFVSEPELGSRVTDVNGEALFTLDSLGNSGAGTITATYSSPVGDVTARRNVQSVTADDIYTLTITSVTNNGVILDGNPVTVTARLTSTDTANYPVENQVVTAETTIGTVQSPNGARTDSNGDVSFEIASGDIVAAGSVTLTYSDAPNGVVTAATNITVEVSSIGYNLRVVTTTPSGVVTNQFSAITPMLVTVSIVDDNGAVVDVDGEPILLFSNGVGNVTPQLGADPDTGRTLTINGVAEFDLVFDGSFGAGIITAQYEAQGPFYLQATANVEAIVENPYTVSLTSSGDDLTINNPLTLTATVLDENGDPVEGEIVDLTTSIGSLDRLSSTTNTSGQAVFTLTYTSAGAGTVTASVSTVEGTFTNALTVNAVDEAPPFIVAITEILDPDLNGTTTFSSSEPIQVVVQLTDGATPAVAQANRPVSLALSGVAGTIFPDNAVVLTDVTGTARFEVQYGGQTGGGQLTATYASPVGNVSDSAFVTAVVPDLDIGSLDDSAVFQSGVIRALPTESVSYKGSVELLLAVVDANGDLVTTAESVRFESPCLLNGFSTLDSGLNAIAADGLLSVTYTAGANCEDRTDSLTATLLQPGLGAQRTATVDLTIGAAPAANQRFITFVNADPTNIALRGTGGGVGLEERSQVTFEVRDGAGNPVSGQAVTFALSTTTGGIDLADTTATTDANGQVSATVYSGRVATPVRVYATTERDIDTGDTVTVVSDVLSITSGIATQARFTVGADVLNPPNAAVVNGIEVNIVARAYDRFGNPVPNGTAVVFSSECGGIFDPTGVALPTGSCGTENGECSVVWKSQNGAQATCPLNRVTILAHMLGEEGFIDEDSDGYFGIPSTAIPTCPIGTYPPFGNPYVQLPTGDEECFIDNPEAWRDDDEDGTYSGGTEIFIDIDSGATAPNDDWDSVTPPTGSLFNGLACESDGTTCSTQLVSVFSNLELVAGPSDSGALTAALFTVGGTVPLDPTSDTVTAGSYVLRIEDRFGNVPPLGTSLSAQGTGECEVVSPSISVPNTSRNSFYQFGITIRTEANDATTDDYVEITWSIPDGTGNESQLVFDCIP